ncbi:hypothetical protein LPU83_0659 [Rhizobium favelukesii]|uniref:Uncharacterized protein n=1 Tax=Rhizobium favelukesii TaxID=348824 RepID=W6R5V7_9HYPH|nr:hypothetical protein LPU83_0659 [Rhizobium favelukesii]
MFPEALGLLCPISMHRGSEGPLVWLVQWRNCCHSFFRNARGILLFDTALLIGKLPKAICRFVEWRRLRSLRADDTWSNSPWRDM